ncbi:MAG: site-2 protease family protein [Candidatus Bathyarchaeia archaeon]
MSVRISSIFGIPVKIHYTLILAVLLISWTLAAGYMPREYPGLSAGEYWTIGIIGSITLFTSVLIHELAHSYVAKRNGLPVRRIVLFIFGGVSEIEAEPKTPNLEFKVSIAGPASSYVIGIFLWICWRILSVDRLDAVFVAPLEYGSYINVLLASFNLLPAFPLDGGRILRAAIWRRSKDFLRATDAATKVGVAFSYLFIFGGLAGVFLGSLASGLWFILIGWFLKNGAEANLRQTLISEALSNVSVEDIMTREVHSVKPDLSVAELVDEYFSKYKHGGFPVATGSTLLGLVTTEDVRKIPKEKWKDTRTEEIMTPCSRLTCLRPEDMAIDAFMKMSSLSVGRLPVRRDGEVAGIVTRSDIMRVVEIRLELGR